MAAPAVQVERFYAGRYTLLPLIAVIALGTLVEAVDAAGAFSQPTYGRNGHVTSGGLPSGLALIVGLGVLALVVTPFVCFVLGCAQPRKRLLAWLLAPLCAAFLLAFFNSYSEGDDDYSRLIDQYTFPAWPWIAAVCVGAVVAAVVTRVSSRGGLLSTALVAVACLLPIITVGLAGH